jgi:hypothetical protein
MSTKSETDERLGPLLEYFNERLFRVFAHFFCILEFHDDEDSEGDPAENTAVWATQTIQNGCAHASLMAIRDLDDFLTERRRYPDDLKASDFGYLGSHSFLSTAERRLIDKLIVHTTTVGAEAQAFEWSIWELASKCVTQSIDFLAWIENRYEFQHLRLYVAANISRRKAKAIQNYLAMEIPQRIGKGGQS